MHFDNNTLIAAGVFAHLLLTLSKLLFTKPKDQAKMDALAAKMDALLNTVQTVAALLPTVQAAQNTSAQNTSAQSASAQKAS